MLARITGTLLELTPPPPAQGLAAIISPEHAPGFAYQVLIPAYLAQELAGDVAGGSGSQLGETITLHTLEYLESQNQGASFIPRLIGFVAPQHRSFFELLTSVKGLGNKRALRAMAVEPSGIARAIAQRDTRFLQSLPEIGPKLAELIVHELKSKVDGFTLSGAQTTALSAASNGARSSSAVEPKPAPVKSKAKSAAVKSESAPAVVVPIRQTVDALIALGESPLDAERMVARALDRARESGSPVPASTSDLLSAAYASR